LSHLLSRIQEVPPVAHRSASADWIAIRIGWWGDPAVSERYSVILPVR